MYFNRLHNALLARRIGRQRAFGGAAYPLSLMPALLLPCEAGEVARRGSGVTEGACLARTSVVVAAHAPSTTLCVVPLPRCAGAEKSRTVQRLRDLALWGAVLWIGLLCAGCTPIKNPSAGELRRPLLLQFFGHENCQAPGLARTLGRLNSASLYVLHIAPFGREESGWATYAPEIEHEIGTRCAADTAAFADALARWQRRRGLNPTGVMTVATFAVMKDDWQARRPFVELRATGACPAPPRAGDLADAKPWEGYEGKPVQLRKGALAAYRRMVTAARQGEPALAANPELLTLFSAYRSPAYDAARCAHDHNCQGVVRAACSAHRTGLAFDIVLDTAPGYPVDSSADANRLAMVNGLAYRWLVANAATYGFVNYPFEPWHWEWTGEKP